jgi:acetate kinase
MNILALNAGSSSLKAALYALDDRPFPPDAPQPAWRARAEWSQLPGQAEIRVQTVRGTSFEKHVEITSAGEIFKPVLESLWGGSASVVRDCGEIDVVGHRMVHGGGVFRDSTLITPAVRSAIEQLRDLAPAHNQFELEGVEAVGRSMGPGVTQVAVFDTAFHASLPLSAYVYPGPYAWLEQGIRRYGFHGISHQYAAARAARMLGRNLEPLRLISCHLGNGCSLAAIKEGHCVDTTMGFTPLDGLMMGTRSGSVDPGILIYLLRHRGYSADDIEHALNHESGLLGVSGISADMRQILVAMAQGNSRAQLAFDVYVHSVRFHVGAMLPSLGGLDALIFTAGVGENCPQIRSAVCSGFGFPGLTLAQGRQSHRIPARMCHRARRRAEPPDRGPPRPGPYSF